MSLSGPWNAVSLKKKKGGIIIWRREHSCPQTPGVCIVILLLELARNKHPSLPLILWIWLDLLGHRAKNRSRTVSCFGRYSKLAAFGIFSRWVVVAHWNWCILLLKPKKPLHFHEVYLLLCGSHVCQWGVRGARHFLLLRSNQHMPSIMEHRNLCGMLRWPKISLA